ncbi:hypothetical protein ACHMW6_16795 [Pseudoduganella sp. UC29_106]|uniref:hypothetical protein n=1 Tax=Pseudoduganella sp. UC29_106 TaxID=3374553 RepID=UPI003757D884
MRMNRMCCKSAGCRSKTGWDRITISGDIDLTRDAAGLADARALQSLLASVVAALEAAKDLPQRLPPPAVKTANNPFE